MQEEAPISNTELQEVSEAEITQDFSQRQEEPGRGKKRWLRLLFLLPVLLVLLVAMRSCGGSPGGTDSELVSSKAAAAANLQKAARVLEKSDRGQQSASALAVWLENAAAVPVAVGEPNEDGEVGLVINNNDIVLTVVTKQGVKREKIALFTGE